MVHKVPYDENGNEIGRKDTPITCAADDTQECISHNFMSKSLNCCRRIPCFGMILGALASVFFCIANLTVKFTPNVNPFIVVIFTMYHRYNLFGQPGERLALFARGFCGFVALTLGYLSFRLIPLADASTITSAAPVFVSIFACVILKEECGLFQGFTVTLTIVGVLLVSKPSFIFGESNGNTVSPTARATGSLLALVACLTGACVYIAIRKLPTTPSLVVINAYTCVNIIGSFITVFILAFIFPMSQFSGGIGIPSTWTEVAWLALNGFAGVGGQICLTSALKIEEAGLVALARTSDIIVAFIFQICFLTTESIAWTSYVGAAIVFIAVSLTATRRWLRYQPNKFNQAWSIINCGFPQTRKPTV